MSPESCLQLANPAIYLCDNRDPINQGYVFIFVFHFELTPFSDSQFSKVSARRTVFNWEICEGRIAVYAHEYYSSSQFWQRHWVPKALLYMSPEKND